MNQHEEDNDLSEIFQVFVGTALIEKTKHDPTLNKAVRKKVLASLEKTKLFKETIGRAMKEN